MKATEGPQCARAKPKCMHKEERLVRRRTKGAIVVKRMGARVNGISYANPSWVIQLLGSLVECRSGPNEGAEEARSGKPQPLEHQCPVA